MNLEEMFKNRSHEEISAFAFNTGKAIETLVHAEAKGIKEANNALKAKILTYRQKYLVAGGFMGYEMLRDFDKHFNINVDNKGTINGI